MMNIPQQWARVRPSKYRLIGSITAQLPLLQGEGVLVPFLSTPSVFQQIFFNLLVPRYVKCKTTAAVHLAFGKVGMVDAAVTDEILEPADSWQDMLCMPGDEGFKLIGDTTGGNLYVTLAST